MDLSTLEKHHFIDSAIGKLLENLKGSLKPIFTQLAKLLCNKSFRLAALASAIMVIYLYRQHKKTKCRKIYYKSALNLKILSHLAPQIAKYKPTFYLPSALTQILYAELWRRHKFDLESQSITLEDNGEVVLEWFPQNFSQMDVNTPIVVFKLGVCGTTRAPYCQELCAIMVQKGWRMVVVHRRGFGYNHLVTSTFMHKEEEFDLDYVSKKVKEIYPYANLYLLGVSAGANFAANYLGKVGADTPFKAFCSISNPYNICRVSYNMSTTTSTSNKIYSKFIAKNMMKMFNFHYTNPHVRKVLDQQSFNLDEFTKKLEKQKNSWTVDKHLTIRFGGYESIFDYHHHISCEHALAEIKLPSLFINNREDPICVKESVPIDKIYKNENFILLMVERGGHIEYLSGRKPEWWAFNTALEYFSYFEKSGEK